MGAVLGCLCVCLIARALLLPLSNLYLFLSLGASQQLGEGRARRVPAVSPQPWHWQGLGAGQQLILDRVQHLACRGRGAHRRECCCQSSRREPSPWGKHVRRQGGAA